MNNCKRFGFVVIGKPIIPILQRQTVISCNLFTFMHRDDMSGNPNAGIFAVTFLKRKKLHFLNTDSVIFCQTRDFDLL